MWSGHAHGAESAPLNLRDVLAEGAWQRTLCRAIRRTGRTPLVRYRRPPPIVEVSIWTRSLLGCGFGQSSLGAANRDMMKQAFPTWVSLPHPEPSPSESMRLTPLASSFAVAVVCCPGLSQELAVSFDGIDDGVEIQSTEALDLTGPFTFEAWLKPVTSDVIFRKDGFDKLSYQFAAAPGWGAVGINWVHNQAPGSWCSTGDREGPSDWTHRAAAFDGTTLRIYIDGHLAQECPMPAPTPISSAPLRIGWINSAIGGQQHYGLVLDNLRIWNVARTESDIQATINTEIGAIQASGYPGLVASWTFQGTLQDSAGSHHGMAIGDPAFVDARDVPILFDCNANGTPDGEEIALGAVSDCNSNGIPDECDIASGASLDLDANGVPDECAPPSLTADLFEVSLSKGGTQELTLDAGPTPSFNFYFVLGSTSGTAPGVSIDGLTLPLNYPDSYLDFTLASPNSAQLVNTFGVLSPTGQGTASIKVPPATDPSLAGLWVNHAFLVMDLQAASGTALVTFVSNPAPLNLVE